MIRQLKFLGGLLLAAGLAACGGGGGSAGITSGSTGGGSATTPVAASIEAFTSAPELTSASGSSVSFTVVVKDSNNQAIPGQTVTFSASSGNLVGSLPIPAVGSAGEAITSVTLTPGEDRSNRNITVTVGAGSVSRQVVVPVVGSKLGLSGDSSLLLGGTSTFTVRALDSLDKPVPGITITLKSAAGNAITPATVTTGSTGAATFNYVGSRAGVDTISATGLGASASAQISVSSDAFQFTSPAASTSIPVNATQSVSVTLRRSGTLVAGQTVTFSTTRGSVTPLTAVTNAQGVASAVVSSSSSGAANIVAQVPSSQVSLPVQYVATQVASVVVQANPGAVPPNSSGSTANQATVQATVRDPAGNPVAGQVVNFTLVTDGSNGTITPGSATTDASGNAQTQFVPGGLSTANNGVVVRASVGSTGVTGQTTLTVNTQALFISIGTSNVIGQFDPQTYEKEFTVYVTDANGAPAVNRPINLEVVPTSYFKGQMVWNEDDSIYVTGTRVQCANEDANRNGILESGEDINGNGMLEPGLPVAVVPSTVTTSATGFATFKLRYGANYATWVSTQIIARATVGGTESVKSIGFTLGYMVDDFTTKNVPPASASSPFGTSTSCTDPS